MTDYSKLVEMLEAIVSNGELGSAGFAKQALPLARQLIEENERLTSIVESYIASGPTNPELSELYIEEHNAVVSLQARLSLAEQESKWYREDRDRLQSRLSAAEEVVEAAKDHQTHPDAKLMRTIRQYEGGKKQA